MWATDDTGPTAESPPTDGTDAWDDRPPTYSDGCAAEPLDTSVEDCYALREPIAHSAEVVDKDRYLDEDGAPLTAFEAVGSYIEQRHGEGTTAERHGWVKGRQYYAKQQYRRGMAMDRQLLDCFGNPTTALLSLRLSPTTGSRLTLLSALGDAVGPTIDQLRYRLQRAPDAPLAATEWAYFAVIAGTEKRATPHLHVLVYCSGDVSRERFVPVVETFVEKCDYAPDDGRGNASDGGAISLRGNGSDTVPQVDDGALDPTDCEYRGRNSQGAVYVLTQLPHLRDVDDMARDELLHGSTVDAWGGDAFRRSRVEIEEEYLATGPV